MNLIYFLSFETLEFIGGCCQLLPSEMALRKEKGQMAKQLNAERIFEIGNGFKSAKVLLTAVEIGVFTELAQGPKGLQELIHSMGLSSRRSSRDFFDCLVSLGLLDLDSGKYANSAEADCFLDKKKASYIGGLLEMYNDRLYGFWGNFTEALKTGEPQNEIKDSENFFSALYRDPIRLSRFMQAMAGISLIPAKAAAEKFNWENRRTIADIGCAQGVFLSEIIKRHPHLKGIGFDLEPVQPIFESYIEGQGIKQSLAFQKGDFFKDPLPKADVLIFGQILHDWSLEERMHLLRKAYQALPAGGSILIYELIIDDERRKNALGLLSSLTMLIETQEGFDFTGKECKEWLHEAGFEEIKAVPLTGHESMVTAMKGAKD